MNLWTNDPTQILFILGVHSLISLLAIIILATLLRNKRHWSAHVRHRMMQYCTYTVILGCLSVFLPTTQRQIAEFTSDAEPQTNEANIDSQRPATRLQLSDPQSNLVQTERSDPPVIILIKNQLPSLVLNIWIIASGLLFLRLLFSVYQAYRLKQSSLSFTLSPSVLNRLEQKFGLRKFDIRTHIRVNSPLTLGFLQPTILLPNNQQFKLEQQKHIAVLWHEIGHVIRKDNLDALICQIAICIFWFNPAIHWLVRQQSTERELACDDIARSCGIKPEDYSRHLLDLVEHQQLPVYSSYSLGISSANSLQKRITSLFDPDKQRHRRMGRPLLLASSCMALLCLSLFAGAMPRLIPATELSATDLTPGSVIKVITAGKTQRLKQLLNAGADPNPDTQLVNKPLYHAISQNDFEAFEVLIEAGAEWQSTENLDAWYLEHAIYRSPEIAERFIAMGAQLNGVGLHLRTPLIAAIEAERISLVKRLLEAGADPDTQSNHRMPLLEAIKQRSPVTLKLLIDANANLNAQMHQGYAVEQYNGKAPLISVIEQGEYELTKMLIEGGADLNQNLKRVYRADGTKIDITPILAAEKYALQFGDKRMLELLQLAGAIHDSRSPDAQSYLETDLRLMGGSFIPYIHNTADSREIRARLSELDPEIKADRVFIRESENPIRNNPQTFFFSALLNYAWISDNRQKSYFFNCRKTNQTNMRWVCELTQERYRQRLDSGQHYFTVAGSINEAKATKLLSFAKQQVADQTQIDSSTLMPSIVSTLDSINQNPETPEGHRYYLFRLFSEQQATNPSVNSRRYFEIQILETKTGLQILGIS